MKSLFVWLCSGILFLNILVASVRGADPAPALTDDDKKKLEALLVDTVVDPKGCQRVAVTINVRTVWTGSEPALVEGWLKEDAVAKSKVIYFSDGSTMAVKPDLEVKPVDFLAYCKQRYSPPKAADSKEDQFEDRFKHMHMNALGIADDANLALAAWLYRLGEESLAAHALAAAKPGERERDQDPRDGLRRNYAWSLYAKLVHAYMVRADEEALAAGELLLKRFPEHTKEGRYSQAAQIVADLQRRKAKETFGKQPEANPPKDFAQWTAEKQIAYWIEQLDEVDARQDGQPGGISFTDDARIIALIKLGDAAVPALIDVLDQDKRLTRSVHFWRDFADSRTVIGVPEAAMTALMSIMRVRAFDPVSTGDNFTARGEEHKKSTAEKLREYWNNYGKLPFDERMMKVLTDPKTSTEAKCEAAHNLATLNDSDFFSTTVFFLTLGTKIRRAESSVD